MRMGQEFVNELLSKVIVQYKRPEDVDNAKDHLVGSKHYCWGCEWGTPMADRVVCPFVEGSCARYPQTLLEPDPNGMEGMIEDHRKRRSAARAKAKAAEKRKTENENIERDEAVTRAAEENERAKAEAEEKLQEEQAEMMRHVKHIDDRIQVMKKVRDDMAREAEIKRKMIELNN